MKNRKRTLLLAVVLAVLGTGAVLLGMGAFVATAAPSATITVDTLDDENDGTCDPGNCSLREAIDVASSGDLIDFSVAGTIFLDPVFGDLIIDKSLTIDGGEVISVSGDYATRVFNVYTNTTPVDVTLMNIAVIDGINDDIQDDCGIYVGDYCGGGMIIQGVGASVLLSNTVFQFNESDFGGAIANQGSLTIVDSLFNYNFANSHGGAIESYESEFLVISSTQFANNLSGEYGGAIAAYDAEASFYDVEFMENGARYMGGGLFSDLSTISISASEFITNFTDGIGGGVGAHSSTVSVDSSHLISNTSVIAGGGVFQTDNDAFFEWLPEAVDGGGGGRSTEHVSHSRNGRSTSDIVATHNNGDPGLYLMNTTLVRNSSDYGGGVLVEYTDAEITAGTIFSGNSANYGGGIYSFETDTIVDDTQFIRNAKFASSTGGGAMIASSALSDGAAGSLSITDAYFYQNGAEYGGAIELFDVATVISGTTFEDNSSFNSGALLAERLADLQIYDSAFVNNSGFFVGAMSLYTSTAVISNTDFYDNNSFENGGAIFASDFYADAFFMGPIITRGTEEESALGFSGREMAISDEIDLSRIDTDSMKDRFPAYVSPQSSVARAVLADLNLTLDQVEMVGNGTEGGLGGAIFASVNNFANSLDVVIQNNSAFTGNVAAGGGAIFIGNATIDVDDSSFDYNSAMSSFSGGGAIASFGPVAVTDSEFVGNMVQGGGPIIIGPIDPGTGPIDPGGGRAVDSVEGSGGGAIFAFNEGVVSGSTFISNSTEGTTGGGAIYSLGSLDVSDSEFDSNVALANSDGGVCDIMCDVREPDDVPGGNGGGAIYAVGTMSVTDSIFTDNNATGVGGEIIPIWPGSGGGAIYFAEEFFIVREATDGHANAMISNSLFAGNVTSDTLSGGGAIYTRGSMDIVESTFTHNEAISLTADFTGGGGAIYVNQQDVTTVTVDIENSLFYSNSAENGGAIYNYDSIMSITDSAVLNNTAEESGGGVYARSGFVIITTTFSSDAEVYLDGVTIAGNTAQTVRGGGLYVREGVVVDAVNSTISGNSALALDGTADDAGNGGGVYIGALVPNYVTFNNVTITDNDAAGYGGGIDFNRLNSSDQMTLTNTIVAGNTDVGGAPDCYDNNTAGYTLTLDGNNLFGGIAGDVCADNAGASDLSLDTLGLTIGDVLDPLADNDGLSAGSDLADTMVIQTHALVDDSPAIDAGNPDTCVLYVDQRDSTRPLANDGQADAICDIGAFEAGQAIYYSFLPIIATAAPVGTPDLIIESVTLSANNVEVVIKNQGTGATFTDFWVDVYIDPLAAPTRPNETWEVTEIGGEAIVWGIVDVMIQPGESLTLDLGSSYYSNTRSEFSGSIAAGTQMYAQVDSANVATEYGNVLESHENSDVFVAEGYNNITSFVADTAMSVAN